MFTGYPVLSRISLLLIETVVTIFSYIFANYVRNRLGLSTDVYWKEYWNLLFIIIIIWGGLSEYFEAYAGSAFKSGRYQSSLNSLKKEITIVFRMVLFGCPIVYFISLVIGNFTEWIVPKSLVLIFGVINFSMLSTEKILVSKYIEYHRKKEKNIRKVLVLGTGDVAKQFLDSIDNKQVNVLGLISKEGQSGREEYFGYKVVGYSDSLEKTLHANYIDELVIALPAKYLGDIEEVVSLCDREGIPVRIVSPFFKNLLSKSRTELAYGLPNIIFSPVERNDFEMAIKRIMDIVVSLTVLLLLLPFLLIIAMFVKFTSEGPVFYKWRIMGLNKKHFVSYKFRTMVENAEEIEKKLRTQNTNEMEGVYFKLQNDLRVTPVGRILRKYSLDEIPQLYSVLKGDMSLVGPRPVRIVEKHELENWHRRRFCVKPGVTSTWVIMGKNKISNFDDIAKLDLDYIDNWSLWLDIKILFKTIPIILFGKNF